jgi:serine/threonine protein kinase
VLISQKYEVLAEIGRGGMGIVYKVRHTSLDTVSALKILPAHLAENPELVARFHREARVMAQLHHPNIVRVIDVDKADDLHYFVMEYVEGRSLATLIDDDGQRPIREVVDIALQVARGLAYAHARTPAVIHRDIKPSNILVERGTGRAVVTDFGLAKLAGGAESIQTESGKFLGTLRYCSPEQLTGLREVDARVDVYALGMVIYEAWAGRSVYADLERPQIVAALLSTTGEHPFRFDASTPELLRQVILRATAKDRDRRHPTVDALRADLERLYATVGDPSPPPTATFEAARPPARSRSWWLATAAAVGVTAAVGVSLVLRDRARTPPQDGAPAPAAASGAAGAGEKDRARIRKFVSVMDFTLGSPDPQFAWMRDAIRDTLNSRLSSAPECKVFSKEFIDFKAQQMVREGQYQDVKAAAMQVAQTLGVTKAVLGSFRADRDTLHIEAHLVDMMTGEQEASETVDGPQDAFVQLQATLARKLMTRLGVTPPPEESAPVQAAEAGADLENYRLLLQAEGQAAPAPPPAVEPKAAPTKARPDKDRRGSLPPRSGRDALTAVLELVTPADAAAVDSEAPLPSAEDEIRAMLERYRRACELKDLAVLTDVYDHLSPAQVEANRRYFENARDLSVTFEEIDVAVGEDEAVVSYTRRDRFVDGETREPTKVDIRLTKKLVRIEGAWKLVSGGPRN